MIIQQAKRFLIKSARRVLPRIHSPRLSEPIYTFLTKSKADEINPVLLYHFIGPKESNPLVSNKIHLVDQDIFYSQLNQLKKAFTIITIDELVQVIRKGQRIRRLAAVTFDDGYKSVLLNAMPVLKALDIPATFYISTKIIEEGCFWRDKVRFIINRNLVKDFLNFASQYDNSFPKIKPENFYKETKRKSIIKSSQLELLLDKYFKSKKHDLSKISKNIYCSRENLTNLDNYTKIQFGNHTHSHYDLSDLSYEEQYEEISKADKILRTMGLSLSNIFSIPFGGPNSYNAETIKLLQEMNYDGYALSSGKRVIDCCSGQNNKIQRLITVQRFMPMNNRAFLLGD